MKRFISLLTLAILLVFVTTVYAADTTAVLGGGVCINEILVDPDGVNNFDTDGNGTAFRTDEFVELYNISNAPIDITGWQLWDDGVGLWFTFPPSSVIQPGGYAIVVVGVQAGGSLPTPDADSIIFDAGRSSAVMNNSNGDNVVLYDPTADEYVQLLYSGDTPDNPPVDYVGNGFPSTATAVGSIEDWGAYTEGLSLTRFPSGDTNVINHNSIIGAGNASPTAVSLQSVTATNLTTPLVSLAFSAIVVTLLSGLLLWRRKQS